MRFKDLSGSVWGRLTVIRPIPERKRNEVVYLCRCICGEEAEVLGYNLKMGNTQSCGCLRRERTQERVRLKPFEALYRHLGRTARKGNHAVGISYKDFVSFTKITKCHYCGTPVVWREHKLIVDIHRYNLDRADGNLGYTKDNLVVCCKRCNYGKGYLFTYDEWWDMTKGFRERYERAAESTNTESANNESGEVQSGSDSGESVRQEVGYEDIPAAGR